METKAMFRTEADLRLEIEAVLRLPEGGYLSPEAQALYEADGAKRFAKAHPSLAQRFKDHP